MGVAEKNITRTCKPPFRRSPALGLTLRDCQTGDRYVLQPTRQEWVLGCASNCDIVVRDPYASARHCSLQRSNKNGWLVRDHGSKNGTRINGIRVRVAYLNPGSQIAIGNSQFELIPDQQPIRPERDRIVGQSPSFLKAMDDALRAARGNCSVLILGETGTGKELVARAIHEASRREQSPFVAVNCGGIPKELVRSELFGHMKGAFTGAVSTEEGLFMQAEGGTLFLDELGELPIEQQPHLLRALESGLIRRVGGRLEELVDVRVVAATNRDCLGKNSPLRADLFHRLSTVIIELPPLRERTSDIPLLIERFLQLGEREYGPRNVSAEVVESLSQHEWRGNIRELKNSVVRALALGKGELQLRDFLPGGVVLPTVQEEKVERRVDLVSLTKYERSQRSLLEEAYAKNGSIRAAAKDIGIPKSTFADLCKRYQISTKSRKKK